MKTSSRLALLPIPILLTACAGALASPTPTSTPVGYLPEWTLVWQDEFDGPALDTSRWEAIVDDAYTSARLRTKGKGDWTYGRFDIRAKLPSGQGLWPAIWMLPTDSAYGTWAASGEIDIVEVLGQDPRTVYGSLHYGGAWPKNQHSTQQLALTDGTFADDFHVFRLNWAPNEMRWYVDDRLYATQTQWHTDAAPYPAPFDQNFHLILNVAVGGNWPGYPDATTPFPGQMLVDYVRVYQPAAPY
jgi:beta-glucanase (GH16 family)